MLLELVQVLKTSKYTNWKFYALIYALFKLSFLGQVVRIFFSINILCNVVCWLCLLIKCSVFDKKNRLFSTGVKKASGCDDSGTGVLLQVQNSLKDISISMLSDDKFSEVICICYIEFISKDFNMIWTCDMYSI